MDGTKRDDRTKDDGNDDGEESRRVSARLAADGRPRRENRREVPKGSGKPRHGATDRLGY